MYCIGISHENLLLLKLFAAWRREKGIQNSIDKMEPEILADTLENFYKEARNAKGEPCSNNTLLSIRHGLDRFLTGAPRSKSFSIVHDRQFKRANEALKAHLEQLSNEGIVSSLARRRVPIAEADIKRLFLQEQLGLHTPDSLIQTTFFYFIIFSGKCAREHISFVSADDFRFEKTSNGQGECLVFNASCQADETSIPGCFRVSSWPGNPCCPVVCFKKYLSKRNRECPGFWQNPRDFRANEFDSDDPVWFRPAAIGKNRLKGLVAEMSKKARLSTLYTSQNIIFTSLEAVKTAAIEYGALQGVCTYAMTRQEVSG